MTQSVTHTHCSQHFNVAACPVMGRRVCGCPAVCLCVIARSHCQYYILFTCTAPSAQGRHMKRPAPCPRVTLLTSLCCTRGHGPLPVCPAQSFTAETTSKVFERLHKESQSGPREGREPEDIQGGRGVPGRAGDDEADPGIRRVGGRAYSNVPGSDARCSIRSSSPPGSTSPWPMSTPSPAEREREAA